jgi:hypothetical protein
LAPQFAKSQCWRLTAVFAVLLIAGLGLVQSVHVHEELAPSRATRTHCALCVFSHSPAVITAAGSAPAKVPEVAYSHLAEPQLQSRLLVASAFVRPPPSL